MSRKVKLCKAKGQIVKQNQDPHVKRVQKEVQDIRIQSHDLCIYLCSKRGMHPKNHLMLVVGQHSHVQKLE